LFRPATLAARVGAIAEETGQLLRCIGETAVPSAEEVVAGLGPCAERIRRHVGDTGRYLRTRLKSGTTLLAEGAHGAMLDLTSGTYPFVTSSHCAAGAVATGLEIALGALDASLLVLKAYATRVGAGPFPTELHDDTGEYLRKRGNEYGTSTGRPRRTGWFDSVVARTAVELSGASAVAITKLDCLDELDEIPVSLGYKLDGQPVSDLRALAEDVARLEPEYEKLPGWKTATTGLTRYEQLPAAAQRYVRALENAVGAPAVLISTAPRREETIWRPETPFLGALPRES